MSIVSQKVYTLNKNHICLRCHSRLKLVILNDERDCNCPSHIQSDIVVVDQTTGNVYRELWLNDDGSHEYRVYLGTTRELGLEHV